MAVVPGATLSSAGAFTEEPRVDTWRRMASSLSAGLGLLGWLRGWRGGDEGRLPESASNIIADYQMEGGTSKSRQTGPVFSASVRFAGHKEALVIRRIVDGEPLNCAIQSHGADKSPCRSTSCCES